MKLSVTFAYLGSLMRCGRTGVQFLSKKLLDNLCRVFFLGETDQNKKKHSKKFPQDKVVLYRFDSVLSEKIAPTKP